MQLGGPAQSRAQKWANKGPDRDLNLVVRAEGQPVCLSEQSCPRIETEPTERPAGRPADRQLLTDKEIFF